MDFGVLKDLVELRDAVRKNEISTFDDEIMKKLRAIENKLEDIRPAEVAVDSPVKIKRKKEIINILIKHRRLTSSQLSSITGSSRTRCNEYLREMEKNGMLRGAMSDNKKYYELIK